MHDALDGFVDVVAGLHDDDWVRATGCPGWDVHDVVAHVIGLEDVLTGGREPAVELPPELPHVRSEMSRYCERHVQARRGLATAALVEELSSVVVRRRIQLDGNLSVLTPWWDEQPRELVDTLGIRAFDIFSHEQDIRRAVARPGHLDGPAAAAHLKRTLRAIAERLPDRVVADEASLVLTVVGEQLATLWLDLGRGEVLDARPELPTVTVQFRFVDLVALVCGREDASDPARVAVVTGSDALAARVLTSLAITP